jgi:sulfur-carrier protein adenylyltransferase/sulfurtransferase
MGYKLVERVKLVVLEDQRVYLVDDELLELEGCSEMGINALKRLKNGCELEALKDLLDEKERRELLQLLAENGLLRENWSNQYSDDIVEKQIYYLEEFGSNPNILQHKLQQATVAIVGVGGVGAVILQHLVGAGIKSFILIDYDKVERHNLNRQFIYNSKQLGMLKVEAAKKYIHQIDNNIRVNIYPVMIDSVNSLSVLDGHNIDLLINAADQPANLDEILNEYSLKRRIPWVGASVGLHVGTWGPFIIPDKTMCMECFYRIENQQMDKLEYTIRERINPLIKASFGPTNTIISTFLAKDVILYLATQDSISSLQTRCEFDFRNLKMNRFRIAHLKPCSCWKEN